MWRRLRRLRFRRTTLLLLGSAAFLVGLALARRHLAPTGLMVLMAGVAVAVVWWRWRRTATTLAAVILFGLLLGGWRGTAYLHQLSPYQEFARQKVTLTGTVSVDAVYGQKSQLSFVVRDVEFTYPYRQHAPGQIKVSGFGVPMTYRGDRVEVSGKLYPTRGANQASIGYAQLKIVEAHNSVIDEFRRKFAAGMQTALPEPAASFGMGLLVGQRNTLPDEITQALLMVGLTHIIAVSGYNLTILLNASRRLLGGRSKLLSTVVALGLIATFLLITGASASIVRASVISVLGLTAWYFGRTIRPVLLILFAAALTAYANPVYLWADIGWYLSFLAFFGVLVIAPGVLKRLYKAKEPPLLVQIGVETLCAELMTIPLVLYIFGQVSLVGLLANMLVAALIPLAMLFSFVAGLAGMLANNIAGWFAWPANVLLTYMLDVARLLSRIPHVFQENRYLSVADMVTCYVFIASLVLFAWRRKRKKSDWQAIFTSLQQRNTRSVTGVGQSKS